MKKIEAFIKPFKLDDVREALSGLGLSGVTVTEARSFGQPGAGGAVSFRGAPLVLDFVPRLKLELFLEDEQVEPVLSALERAAATGRQGDGEIVVSSLEQLIRIRPGDGL